MADSRALFTNNSLDVAETIGLFFQNRLGNRKNRGLAVTNRASV